MKVINGKQINITKAGYLYIDGVKQKMRCTPISGPKIDDDDIRKYVDKIVNKRWIMVNN